MIIIAVIAGLLALVYAGYLALSVNKEPMGTPKMRELYEAIRQGSKTYLKRQYKTIAIITLVIAVLLYFAFDSKAGKPFTAFAFLLGAAFSLIAGYVGMDIATRANVRTAFAAKSGSSKPLRIAFYGGLVMGLFNVGLSLLGVTTLFYLYGKAEMIIGFAFGASLSALFAQLGGGIYTKAADVGADLVGKVEKNIPEDDPRNPAVIADNVGDCAGRGADLFESTAGENIGAMIIGSALFLVTNNFYFLIFPLLARAVGIFATILGVPFVRSKSEDPFAPLRNGMIATTIFSLIGFYFLVMYTLNSIALYFAGVVGILASTAILVITEYYTSKKYRPVRDIAEASKTGSGTNIIAGFANALESTALPVILIVVAILASYYFGGLFAASNSKISYHLGGVYGTAVATMGILSVAGMVLGLDGFGPIADNAGGIAEMANLSKKMRNRLDPLDAVGNTTKALTKGYAMASAGLAAILLFQAYLELVKVNAIDIVNPVMFTGLFLGALLPFLFASFAMRAVGKAAFKIVEEVRRQFREIKGLMKGTSKPDYSKAVDICTKAAQKEMIIPGLLVLLFPIAIGFLFGAAAVGAFLIGATISGFILAMLMNTGGGAWDNAKKYIESGVFGGKGSDAHKAAVVGDTFGDPLKDTAGPSLHVLIKLINTISLTFGLLFVAYALV